MTRAEKIDLIRSRPQLSVATLSADMGNQNAALQILQENNVNLLHFDVMDGNIWPNITVGSPLPILSYGGSSMMAIMLGLGIVMSCKIYKDTPVN